jgi:hypothetical protein
MIVIINNFIILIDYLMKSVCEEGIFICVCPCVSTREREREREMGREGGREGVGRETEW